MERGAGPEAYDPVLAPLDDLRKEADDLSADGFPLWQESPDAAHRVWGKLAVATKVVADLQARFDALVRGDGEKKTIADNLRRRRQR